MSLLVVGPAAFDSIETPHGMRERVIGGSGVYFAYAASFFTKVGIVGAAGNDWLPEHTDVLTRQGVDVSGLHVDPNAKSFFWHGRYAANMNERENVQLDLNVLDSFVPTLTPAQCQSEIVFLANTAPERQLHVVRQLKDSAKASTRQRIVADTMDVWITEQRTEFLTLLEQIDGLVLNDIEAKLLTGCANVVSAAQSILALGVDFAIVKKGEHGCLYASRDELLVLPSFPATDVVDPTGAGDTFAGALFGHMAGQGNSWKTAIPAALVYGTVTASFTVEGFSLERLEAINRADIDERVEWFRAMLRTLSK